MDEICLYYDYPLNDCVLIESSSNPRIIDISECQRIHFIVQGLCVELEFMAFMSDLTDVVGLYLSCDTCKMTRQFA
jgi:hypothetical protein